MSRRRLFLKQESGLLPVGFKELNWIGSNNTCTYEGNDRIFVWDKFSVDGAYINPEVIYSVTKKTGLVTRLAMLGSETEVSYSGYVSSGNMLWFAVGSYGTGDMYALNTAGTRNGSTTPFDNDFHVYECFYGRQSIDGKNVVDYSNRISADVNNFEAPILLLTHAFSFGATHTCYSKMSHAQMYEGETLIRDLIPCIRKKDSEVGMYDLCGSICPLTGTPFYTNAGTGSFIYG